MEEIENRNLVLKRLDVIYKIISIISGVLLLFLGLFHNVNSQFVIVSSIYLTTVFIFIFSGKLDNIYYSRFLVALKQSGVTGVYLNSRANFRSIVDTLRGKTKLGKAKNIKILVYHGHDLLRCIKDPLKEAIKDNAKVRIIIAENDSDYINDVWKLESIYENKSIDEKKKENREQERAAFGIIKELLETSEKEGGNFMYRRYTTQARYALIAVNKMWGWWTPYQPGIKVLNTTSFILEKKEAPDDSTVLGQCIGHFNNLWDALPDPAIKGTIDMTETAELSMKYI
jgi:hypothetical protein